MEFTPTWLYWLLCLVSLPFAALLGYTRILRYMREYEGKPLITFVIDVVGIGSLPLIGSYGELAVILAFVPFAICFFAGVKRAKSVVRNQFFKRASASRNDVTTYISRMSEERQQRIVRCLGKLE